MTSPLKKIRQKKQEILMEMNGIIMILLAIYPKSSLDRMDMRVLKKMLKGLKEFKEKGSPV